jgi:hypothetical protein
MQRLPTVKTIKTNCIRVKLGKVALEMQLAVTTPAVYSANVRKLRHFWKWFEFRFLEEVGVSPKGLPHLKMVSTISKSMLGLWICRSCNKLRRKLSILIVNIVNYENYA